MRRLLGIDYGTKRIGLAVGDTEAGIASPLQTIEARGTIADYVSAVLAAANEYDIDAFVVGLPVNMDGTEGGQAKITRKFGDELSRKAGKPMHYWDERLSSFTARELLQPAELSRKKQKAVEDSVAAQVILQGYLDARSDKDDEV
ncbi:MAG: Holliday junction resolvase RuvX [Phycisphaerae bacterium]